MPWITANSGSPAVEFVCVWRSVELASLIGLRANLVPPTIVSGRPAEVADFYSGGDKATLAPKFSEKVLLSTSPAQWASLNLVFRLPKWKCLGGA